MIEKSIILSHFDFLVLRPSFKDDNGALHNKRTQSEIAVEEQSIRQESSTKKVIQYHIVYTINIHMCTCYLHLMQMEGNSGKQFHSSTST